MTKQERAQKTIDEFMHIVTIATPSFEEEPLFDYLKERLAKFPVTLDYQPYHDDKYNKDSANLIAHLAANEEGHDPIFFDSHCDTVPNGIGIEPIIDGDIIRSKGKTILGGDDKAGIAAMLIALEELTTTDKKHGDVYFFFTSAEEPGIVGAQHVDFSNINVKYGFALDGEGILGRTTIVAPSFFDYIIDIEGRGSHAGIAPEKGINAIKIAGKIINDIPQGKVNEDFVTNLALIEGGSAMNVVAPRTTIKGETRCFSEEVEQYVQKLYPEIAAKYKDEAVDIKVSVTKRNGGFFIKKDDPIVKFAKKAYDKMGIEMILEKCAGGSNPNVYNEAGIPCITLSIGEEEAHTTNEFIKIENLTNSTEMLLAFIEVA